PPRSTLFPYTTLFRSAISRPPLNRRRLLLLRSRRVQDRSRKSSNLRQPSPSVRRHNLSPPTQRESQPMARSKLPLNSDRRGPSRSEEHTSELQSREHL